MGVNGIYGLSGSGLDIESLVKVGMMSKQNEYDKMAQKYTKNEWLKTAYLDTYNTINTFNMSTLSDYKMSSTMNAKTAVSTNSAINATASAKALLMSHSVEVTERASNAYLISTNDLTRYGSDSTSTALKDVLFQNLDDSLSNIKIAATSKSFASETSGSDWSVYDSSKNTWAQEDPTFGSSVTWDGSKFTATTTNSVASGVSFHTGINQSDMIWSADGVSWKYDGSSNWTGSIDSGGTLTHTDSTQNWSYIPSSGGVTLQSSNNGATWTSDNWTYTTSSSTWTNSDYNNGSWVRKDSNWKYTNGDAIWTKDDNATYWTYATTGKFSSSDSGSTWQYASSDGVTLQSDDSVGTTWTYTNGGTTWTYTSASSIWSSSDSSTASWQYDSTNSKWQYTDSNDPGGAWTSTDSTGSSWNYATTANSNLTATSDSSSTTWTYTDTDGAWTSTDSGGAWTYASTDGKWSTTSTNTTIWNYSDNGTTGTYDSSNGGKWTTYNSTSDSVTLSTTDGTTWNYINNTAGATVSGPYDSSTNQWTAYSSDSWQIVTDGGTSKWQYKDIEGTWQNYTTGDTEHTPPSSPSLPSASSDIPPSATVPSVTVPSVTTPLPSAPTTAPGVTTDPPTTPPTAVVGLSAPPVNSVPSIPTNVPGASALFSSDTTWSSSNSRFENGTFHTTNNDFAWVSEDLTKWNQNNTLNIGSASTTDTAFEFSVTDGSGKAAVTISYKYSDLLGDSGKTLVDLANKITKDAKAGGLNIQASYDAVYDKFSIYNTKSGAENTVELTFGNTNANRVAQAFFNNLEFYQSRDGALYGKNGNEVEDYTASNANALTFSLTESTTLSGTDSTVKIDGVNYTATENRVTVGDVTYDTSTAKKNDTATVSITQDVDGIVDKVKSFVEEYNTLLAGLYEKYDEKTETGYSPLTQAQKDAMKDEQIEKWETKAKAGLLYHDQTIAKIISNMRNAISSTIDGIESSYTDSSGRNITYNSAYSIGISTTGIKGQLVLDEEKLRTALANDSESVYKVFGTLVDKKDSKGNSVTDTDKSGIAQRLGEVFVSATSAIKTRSGTSADVTEDSDLNNLLRQLQTKMSNFKKMMTAFEERLYKKYDAMESALASLGMQLNFISGASQ